MTEKGRLVFSRLWKKCFDILPAKDIKLNAVTSWKRRKPNSEEMINLDILTLGNRELKPKSGRKRTRR